MIRRIEAGELIPAGVHRFEISNGVLSSLIASAAWPASEPTVICDDLQGVIDLLDQAANLANLTEGYEECAWDEGTHITCMGAMIELSWGAMDKRMMSEYGVKLYRKIPKHRPIAEIERDILSAAASPVGGLIMDKLTEEYREALKEAGE